MLSLNKGIQDLSELSLSKMYVTFELGLIGTHDYCGHVSSLFLSDRVILYIWCPGVCRIACDLGFKNYPQTCKRWDFNPIKIKRKKWGKEKETEL